MCLGSHPKGVGRCQAALCALRPDLSCPSELPQLSQAIAEHTRKITNIEARVKNYKEIIAKKCWRFLHRIQQFLAISLSSTISLDRIGQYSLPFQANCVILIGQLLDDYW